MKASKFISLLLLLILFIDCKSQNPTLQEKPQVETIAVNQLKSVDVRGEELHYIQQGSGEPLIFIHGTIGDYRVWNSRMEPYSKHYNVIAYSRR